LSVAPANALTTRFVCDVYPYSEQLYAVARRMTHTRADAEDLVQETMLKAYANFDSFSNGTNLRAWLFRIMRNTWITAYQARQRRPSERLTWELTDWQFAQGRRRSTGGQRSAEAEYLQGVLHPEISYAMGSLPASVALVVYLVDIEGRSCTELARLMNVPPGTISSRLHRGHERLRAFLADTAWERMMVA
jgi:RNA polymerase sigma-70 factor (ECF subfamily)